jgi:hypothetical protein
LAVGNPDAVVANSKCKSVPLHDLAGALQEFRLPIRCGDRAGHRHRPCAGEGSHSRSGTYTAPQLQHAAPRFADDNVLCLQRPGVPNRSLVSEVCWAQASVEVLRAYNGIRETGCHDETANCMQPVCLEKRTSIKSHIPDPIPLRNCTRTRNLCGESMATMLSWCRRILVGIHSYRWPRCKIFQMFVAHCAEKVSSSGPGSTFSAQRVIT